MTHLIFNQRPPTCLSTKIPLWSWVIFDVADWSIPWWGVPPTLSCLGRPSIVFNLCVRETVITLYLTQCLFSPTRCVSAAPRCPQFEGDSSFSSAPRARAHRPPPCTSRPWWYRRQNFKPFNVIFTA